ncbi:MAG: rRNA maturation RNase YbeY [Sphaerochaetaceae bacterium]
MAEIEIYQEEQEVNEGEIRTKIGQILGLLGKSECAISCAFVSLERIRELNRTYRMIDESTDILSFSPGDTHDIFNLEDPSYLGDLVISLATVQENCQYFGVEESEELTRVLVHGILHLLGWEHATNSKDEAMLIKQEEILGLLKGVGGEFG